MAKIAVCVDGTIHSHYGTKRIRIEINRYFSNDSFGEPPTFISLHSNMVSLISISQVFKALSMKIFPFHHPLFFKKKKKKKKLPVALSIAMRLMRHDGKDTLTCIHTVKQESELEQGNKAQRQ